MSILFSQQINSLVRNTNQDSFTLTIQLPAMKAGNKQWAFDLGTLQLVITPQVDTMANLKKPLHCEIQFSCLNTTYNVNGIATNVIGYMTPSYDINSSQMVFNLINDVDALQSIGIDALLQVRIRPIMKPNVSLDIYTDWFNGGAAAIQNDKYIVYLYGQIDLL